MELSNPFSYEAATNLNIDEVLDWYVPDHNQGPLINSSRNLFLFGERGCGKSMTLRNYSLEAKIRRSTKLKIPLDLDYIGIYVKCNAPLIWKREYELIKRDDEGKAKAALLSEHILSLWIARALVDQISQIPNLFDDPKELEQFSKRISYLIDVELPMDDQCLVFLSDHLEKRLNDAQVFLAERDPGKHLSTFRGFNSLVVQIMMRLRTLKCLMNSHFMIMLDDAQDLYSHQREAVNSWIAYRDHSIFSLKVAVARRQSYDFCTASGSSILEIHDFSSLDLQTPYQNSSSAYAKFVENVLTIRLEKSGISVPADKFFPPDAKFEQDIEDSINRCAVSYLKLNPGASTHQINNYIYKRGRAWYFRDRSPKANRPIYAGLETITEISTGVTRNVLEVAWRSFDLLASKDRTSKVYPSIPTGLQSEAIFACSERLWNSLREGLHKRSARVTAQDSIKLLNLFEQLGQYYRRRLISDISEPRVLSFVISDVKANQVAANEVERILSLAFEHTLMFARPYHSRDGGTLETLYTANKLLWPTFGLDVVGQSGRASIKAQDLLAATSGKEIPFTIREVEQESISHLQLGLDYE
ncbi:MAG: hypothetical protein B7Y56_08270 [Gallionellales bacterium 35-53-114]|jgi:hypothetical protein|nr:MAG: hypothetical protein B7Y56_08270 [Gallionellales bacterium 35-53-114]OYZ62622.1 MAG: hypothetical protein B7Y04_12125 [Gallionellales bacterium 24-53-125]OZB09697.1 MAG: hypothetical protein B7X61_04025 [Gallionellales bacterium 39-52-133]HQS57744.1 hypothetical protein [Gallionellaceae bacterium]HQS74197.1 hypothetical protein [Gallionellaceae bacterium]